MKKIFVVLIALILVMVGACLLPEKSETECEYLRLHIRANSNLDVDQNVKYEIREEIVELLTPSFGGVKSKAEAEEKAKSFFPIIKATCDRILMERGFNYTANVDLRREYFPTRSYQNVTLESGYYDAVIVELGEAKGDNWWCVMYPPLCFVNKNENQKQIKFKSKIAEWFERWFGGEKA